MRTTSAARIAPFFASLAVSSWQPAAIAADTVYLPCPDYKPGNSWRYREQNPRLPATNVVTVLSVQGDSISVGEKKVMTPTAPPGFKGTVPVAEQLAQKSLKRVGRTMFLRDMTMEMSQRGQMTAKLAYNPGEEPAECGDLPKSATTSQSVAVMGQNNTQRSTTVTEAMGRKRIQVPAGEFDTYIVKRVTTSQYDTDMSPQTPAPPTITMIYYAAEGVGTVRTEITTEMMLPTPSKAPRKADPETEAALAEGLAALKEGKDPSAAFEKLKKAGEKAEKSNSSGFEMKPTTSTTVSELESYILK